MAENFTEKLGKVEPLNAFKTIRAKLSKAQRKLARQKKFGANWRKQKAKITRLHRKAANAQRLLAQALDRNRQEPRRRQDRAATGQEHVQER